MVYLHKISTVLPENFYTQEFALEFLTKLIGDGYKKDNFLKRVYQDTAINKRHTVISDYGKKPEDFEFYPKNEKMIPEPDTKARNDLFIKEANRLSLTAVEDLLKKLENGIKNKITHIITVSCTGFSAPGFDFHIVKSLKMNPSIDRFHIGFMGCYASFPALKLAKAIVESDKKAKVLIVNVELCTLHFQQKFEPDTVVANAIFADGVSASFVSGDPDDSLGEKIALCSFYSRLIPDSEAQMSWQIGEHGFDMKLSSYVPKFIDENILPVMRHIFDESGIEQKDIDIWAIHPGGKAILEKLAVTLGLNKDDFKASYDVLWDYGNMSSATIMFVFENILKNEKNGKIFSAAFGPGLTLETGIMEKIK